MKTEHFLWTERYRPKTVAECILPEELKKTFQEFINDGNVPNLLLTGGAGVGKTTIAKAMLDELGASSMVINATTDGIIDTLRTKISTYASAMSLNGGRKYVILDEADYLSHKMQPALRAFIEEYSKNCGFILTCNFESKIIEPLRSRCATINFDLSGKQAPALAAQFFARVKFILDKEGIEYDQKVVAALISKHFPDFRKVINELQKYAVSGKIDTGILTSTTDEAFGELVKIVKDKDFVKMRLWVAQNGSGGATADILRKFYDHSTDIMLPANVPQLVLHLARYQYQAAFVADPEINLAACMTEIMADNLLTD